MILVVDDDKRRHRAFSNAFGRTVRAYGLWKAVKNLSFDDNRFTTIYLDHDGVDGDLIAEWMARHKPHPGAKIIIHSSNAVGSRKMYKTLQAASYDVTEMSFAEVVGEPDR